MAKKLSEQMDAYRALAFRPEEHYYTVPAPDGDGVRCQVNGPGRGLGYLNAGYASVAIVAHVNRPQTMGDFEWSGGWIGDWAAYVHTGPAGIREAELVAGDGNGGKLPQALAEYLFPELAASGLPYRP